MNLKRFIIRNIHFIVIMLILFYSLDILYTHICRPQGYMSSWNDIYNGNINSDIIFFGTSRAQHHIVSDIVQDSIHISTFNLGEGGARSEIQLIRLKELLSHCSKKPKHIFLEVCYYSINKSDEIDNNLSFYMLFNNNFNKYTAQLQNQYKTLDFYFPLKRYAGHFFLNLYNRIHRTASDTCYRGYYNTWDKWNYENYKNTHQFKFKFAIEPLRVAHFKEFIQTCKENNIEISIIYSPEFYNINYTNKEEIINIFKTAADSFGIEFKDFSKDMVPINTDTSYYHDTSHLTAKGAEVFTSEYLVPYLKQLYHIK